MDASALAMVRAGDRGHEFKGRRDFHSKLRKARQALPRRIRTPGGAGPRVARPSVL